ncbi:hypothetical protein [Neobacillus dielmonensis]|uniref:hypothetical protein n=1 Tax=Neobacillus dielmonensis TaxID=1347369 RepID=UPI0005A6ADFA|nr:hypothetical protein [Neobacillus dielmonensis]
MGTVLVAMSTVCSHKELYDGTIDEINEMIKEVVDAELTEQEWKRIISFLVRKVDGFLLGGNGSFT